MKQTIQEQKIAQIVDPVVSQQGHRLVAVKVTSSGEETILQILVEDPQTRNLGVDQCVKISREISTILDVEDPISNAYRLEVSSPGIDRPLVRFEDFVDYNGMEVKIEIAPPIDGQKRFRGYISNAADDKITLTFEDGEYTFDYETIQKAKLVMTEELIEKSKQWVKKTN